MMDKCEQNLVREKKSANDYEEVEFTILRQPWMH